MNHYRAFCAALLLALFGAVAQAQASKLFISEFNSLVISSGLLAQIAPEPSTDQVVDFSGGVTSSAAFANGTSYVRLVCDVQCSVKFGTSPTATTSTKLLPALTPEYFGVPQGGAFKASVIANP